MKSLNQLTKEKDSQYSIHNSPNFHENASEELDAEYIRAAWFEGLASGDTINGEAVFARVRKKLGL